MTQEQSLQIIRDAFSQVDVERIVVEYDPAVEEDVAKINVSDEQLEAALGQYGFYPRGVAMKVGLAIEVVLSAHEVASEQKDAHEAATASLEIAGSVGPPV
jgi:transcription antitermination factor NusA-like protein